MHTDRIYSQQKTTQMLRGRHSTHPLEEIYQVKMFGVHTRLNRLPNALVEEVEGG